VNYRGYGPLSQHFFAIFSEKLVFAYFLSSFWLLFDRYRHLTTLFPLILRRSQAVFKQMRHFPDRISKSLPGFVPVIFRFRPNKTPESGSPGL
jgi:hypothetical protein